VSSFPPINPMETKELDKSVYEYSKIETEYQLAALYYEIGRSNPMVREVIREIRLCLSDVVESIVEEVKLFVEYNFSSNNEISGGRAPNFLMCYYEMIELSKWLDSTGNRISPNMLLPLLLIEKFPKTPWIELKKEEKRLYRFFLLEEKTIQEKYDDAVRLVPVDLEDRVEEQEPEEFKDRLDPNEVIECIAKKYKTSKENAQRIRDKLLMHDGTPTGEYFAELRIAEIVAEDAVDDLVVTDLADRTDAADIVQTIMPPFKHRDFALEAFVLRIDWSYDVPFIEKVIKKKLDKCRKDYLRRNGEKILSTSTLSRKSYWDTLLFPMKLSTIFERFALWKLLQHRFSKSTFLDRLEIESDKCFESKEMSDFAPFSYSGLSDEEHRYLIEVWDDFLQVFPNKKKKKHSFENFKKDKIGSELPVFFFFF